MDINVNIHNRFDLEVIDSKTGKIKQKAFAENVILDQLWSDGINSQRGFANTIAYGSGSGTPAHTDTDLFNYEGETGWVSNENPTKYIDHVNMYGYTRRKAQLTEQQAVGVTFTELGLCARVGVSSTRMLTTHAMLQDMNGNPVSIEKTDADIFNIYSTVYVHWNDRKINFNRDGNLTYAYLFNWLTGDAYTGSNALQYLRVSKGACVHNSQSYGFSGLTTTYDATTKRLTSVGTRIAAANGNFGGFSYLISSNSTNGSPYDAYQSIIQHVSDFYAGDDISGESVGVGDGSTKKFRTKFDFPENADIYVDGVKQTSGVTVRHTPCGDSYSNKLETYICKVYGDSSNGRIMLSPDRTYVDAIDYSSKSHVVRVTPNLIIYNELYNTVGFEYAKLPSIRSNETTYKAKLYGSNDLSSWTLIGEAGDPGSSLTWTTINLDSTSGHYKYYKCEYGYVSSSNYFTLHNDSEDWYNIVFDTAPANGAVITASYHTPCIAKDADHVLDMTMTLQLGEYTE